MTPNEEILIRLKEIEKRHKMATIHGQMKPQKHLLQLDVLWMVQMLEDRCSGKTPSTDSPEMEKMRAELYEAKRRLNELSKVVG